MKKFSTFFILFVFLLQNFSAFADTAVYEGSYKDYGADVAYNSTDDEYLVVWLESYRFTKNLLGKRVDRLGQAGAVFTIAEIHSDFNVSLPSIVYNPEKNEYFLVIASGTAHDMNITGQRLAADGTKRESAALLMAHADNPTVLYNSLANNYLLIGEGRVSIDEDHCDISLYSQKVGSDGFPLDVKHTIYQMNGRLCSSAAIEYSIAYAPVISSAPSDDTSTISKTPFGRYLISAESPDYLKILDSEGKTIILGTDHVGTPNAVLSIPFPSSIIGIAEGWDIAFGYWNHEPVFLLVWAESDTNMTWQNMQWTGIWCVIIDAKVTDYGTYGVSPDPFPISKILTHLSQGPSSRTWNPVVEYNSFANKFMVAWRETPGAEPENGNHIRGNAMGYSDLLKSPIPPDNTILSAVTNQENPYNPVIATSSRGPSALVVWEDNRNFSTQDLDIYGNILTTMTTFLNIPSFTEKSTFDSGWLAIAQGEEKQVVHMMGGNIDDYVVYLSGMDSEGKMERECYGGCDLGNDRIGFYWYGLTQNTINVKRRDEDDTTKKIRVQMWRDPNPDFDSGWQFLLPGDTGPLAHNLGGDVNDYIIDLEFADWPGHPPHQMLYGGITFGNKTYNGNVDGQQWGVFWHSLTSSTVNVTRLPDDQKALMFRGRIWNRPNPRSDSGWVDIAANEKKHLTLSADVNNTFIYYEQKSSAGGINHGYYGGLFGSDWQGSYWSHAKDAKVDVTRGLDDTMAEQVRVRAYKNVDKDSTFLPAVIMYLLN